MPTPLTEFDKQLIARTNSRYMEPGVEEAGWLDRLGASVDRSQAQLLGIGEAMGLDWGNARRENQIASEIQRARAIRDTGAPESLGETFSGLGQFAKGVGGLFVDSAPELATSLAAFPIGGALGLGATGRAALGAAMNYPSAVGDILQNQRDEAGQTRLGAASALGVPYAAVDALGLEGALASGRMLRTGIDALDNIKGWKGGLARTGANAGLNAAVEGSTETFQEGVNQFGRMSVNPEQTFINDESLAKFGESFGAGALMGGSASALMGGWRRSEGYLPPGQNVDNPEKPADLLSGPPTLDPSAQYGLQGDLFDGAGYDTTTNGSRDATSAPDLRALAKERALMLQELPILEEMARSGNEYAAAQVIQYRQRLDAMPDVRGQVVWQLGEDAQGNSIMIPTYPGGVEAAQRQDGQMNLMSGVHEIVNGVPVELTTDELNQNMLPLVGDTNIDFLVGGQPYQYQGGLDFSSAYDVIQEGRPVPNLTTQLDPLQQRIDQNLGINRQGAWRGYPSQFQAAASEPTNQFTQDADGMERRLDLGEFTAMQAGVPPVDAATQRAQAVGQEVKQTQQVFQQTAQRAAAAGLDPKKPQQVRAWGIIEAAIDAGTITQEEGSRLAAGLVTKTETPGSVERFIAGKSANKNAVASAEAADKQAALDAVQGKTNGKKVLGSTSTAASSSATSGQQTKSSTPAKTATTVSAGGDSANGGVSSGSLVAGTGQSGAIDPGRVAWEKVRSENEKATLPEYDALSAAQQSEVRDMAKGGRVNLANAQSLLTIGNNSVNKKARSADDLDFIKDLVAGRTSVSPADAALLQRWLGVEVDQDGNIVLSEGGSASLETIAATLTNERTGKKGVSKQRVHDRIVKALKDAGAPVGFSPSSLYEQLGVKAGGTDIETVERNNDKSEKQQDAASGSELRGSAQATKEGRARAEEMESGTNDDVGKAEAGTTDTSPENLLDQRTDFEIGTVRGYLKDELQAGKIKDSDVAASTYVYEVLMGKGLGTFDSIPVSLQAAVVRRYADARNTNPNDPNVVKAERAANGQRVQPATGNTEAVRGRLEESADDAADGVVSVYGGDGGQVSQAANKAASPTPVVVRKKRRSVAQLNEDVLGGQPTLPINGDVIDVEARVITETLGPVVQALPAPQQTKLAEHYNLPLDSAELLERIKQDVVNYVNKGADAVAGAIRSIIKAIAEGTLAVGIVFNPGLAKDYFQFNLPKSVQETRDVRATVPEDAAEKMSPLAKSVYEKMAPAAMKSGKGFIIADKPNGMLHAFDKDGKLIVQDAALYGKDKGDKLGKSSLEGGAKITPAGKFTLKVAKWDEYAGGYTLDLKESYDGTGYIAIHAAYLGNPADNRLGRLASKTAADNRISYGCINTTHETFVNKFVPNLDKFDGGMTFVLPDNQELADAMFEGDVETLLRTEQNQKANAGTERQVVAKEENDVLDSGNGQTPQAQQKDGSVAESTGSTGPGSAKESVRSGTAKTDVGLSTSEVVEILTDFTRSNTLGRKVIVVQSVGDLPAGIKVSSKKKTQGVAIDDGPYGRVAYLIADNLTSDTVRAVFMHEVGSHLGLDNLLKSKEYANLIDTMKAWARQGNAGSTRLEHQLAFRAAQRVEKAKVKVEDRRSEFLAYFIEEAMLAGVTPTAIQTDKRSPLLAFLRRVMRLFYDVARQLGIDPGSIDTQDIIDMAYGAAQLELIDKGPIPSGESMTTEKAKFSKADSIAAPNTQKSIIDALPFAMQDALRAVKYHAGNWAIKASFTEDVLARLAGKVKVAGDYMREIQKVAQERNRRELAASEILKAHSKLSSTERGTGVGSVNAVLHDSTFKGVWAFRPDWLPAEKYTYDPESSVAKAYRSLSKEGQAVVRQVMQHGHESLQAMKAAVKANIEAEFPNDPAKAAKAMADYQSAIDVAENKPYAPLRRFGKYVVMAKSKAYQEAENNDDKARLRELEKNGDHYYVAFRESKSEQLALKRSLEIEFGGQNEVTIFERMDGNQLGYGNRDIISGMNRLRDLVRNDTELDGKLTKQTKERIDTMMQQLYLTMLAETSARKGEIHRKNIAGADDDMMRAFATNSLAQAQFIANLTSNNKADKALADTLAAIRKMGDDREEAQNLYNEIMRRRSMDMEYTATPLVDKAMGATSAYFLMTNPSYYAINATQPWMMSLPMMAGRFGRSRSVAELMRAYKGITDVVKGGFTETSFKKLPEDVQGVVTALAERGRINISMATDMGNFASGKAGVAHFVERVTTATRSASESVEAINRIATAVAAYRLAKGSGMNDAAAVDFAERVIAETHGDYSAWNAPRFMRTGLGRMATQFRKFQLIQLSMFARFASRALDSNLKPEERKAAALAMSYNIGLLAAMGGLAGLPGATLVLFLMGAMGAGDDDTPDDWEAALRRAVGNKELADLIWYGGPKLMGVNLSGRVGAGDMLSLLPKTDIKFDRDGYYEILAGFAGPMAGGLLPRMFDGISRIKQGDVWEGVEQLVPGGITNAMKAVRFGTEGITRRNGDLAMSPDELSFLDLFAQSVGLPTNTITDRSSLVSAQFKADEFYKSRTTQLKKDYSEAYRSNDTATMSEIRQDWLNTQKARRELGYKVQPLSELLKSPQEQRKREADVVGGVAYKKGNEGFTKTMVELY